MNLNPCLLHYTKRHHASQHNLHSVSETVRQVYEESESKDESEGGSKDESEKRQEDKSSSSVPFVPSACLSGP